MSKTIILHGPAVDSIGHFHDAGATLTVADEPAKGSVRSEVATELLDGGRAVTPVEAKDEIVADLAGLTKERLIELAAEESVDTAGATTKADYVDAIRAHREAAAAGAAQG